MSVVLLLLIESMVTSLQMAFNSESA